MRALRLLALLQVSAWSWAQDPPVVSTSLGQVRGSWAKSRGLQDFMEFRGVPYAKAPVGEHRFMPPQPVDQWSGILEANNSNVKCLQYFDILKDNPIIGAEDCLYLSIFTKNVSTKFPVLVHIHGGAFRTGSGIDDQANYLMDEDVVVVSINYRIGIFGFLSFENTLIPGNQGMKDQVMALKWVKDNIASFGGDPNLVTIIGESAGGSSVHLHLVSPMSEGLFHRAIAESGTAFVPGGLSPPGYARSIAKKLMKLLGCPTDPKQGLTCILKKDSRDIISATPNFTVWQMDPTVTFRPTLEPEGSNPFLVGPIEKWNYKPVPFILGTTSGEGLLRTTAFLGTDFKWLSDNFNRLLPMSLMYDVTAKKPDEITKQLRQFYLPKEEITLGDWKNLTMLYTDGLFAIGILDGANKHKGKTFFYYYDYISKTSGGGPIPLPPGSEKYIIGAFHIAESSLIWKRPTPLPEEQTNLSKQFIKLLINFAKNGEPSGVLENVTWNTWSSDQHDYMHIDNQGFHSERGLAEDRYKFWKSINYRDKFDIPEPSDASNLVSSNRLLWAVFSIGFWFQFFQLIYN